MISDEQNRCVLSSLLFYVFLFDIIPLLNELFEFTGFTNIENKIVNLLYMQTSWIYFTNGGGLNIELILLLNYCHKQEL